MLSIGLFFLWKIPEILNQILPLAVLLATLLTLGLLSRNSEITAMRGSGMSLARITGPILGVALAVSLLALASGEFVVPRTYDKMKYVEDVLIAKKNPSAFFRQSNIWYRENDLVLQAKLYDPPTVSLKGVTLWMTGSDMGPVKRIEAASGVFRNDSWLLRDVVVRTFGEGGVRTATVAQLPVALQLKTADLKVLAPRPPASRDRHRFGTAPPQQAEARPS